MGRSVSYPPGAVVAFRTLENGHEDDWEWEYECLVEEIIETARSTFLSLEPCDGWRGREDRILLRNTFAIAGSLPIAALSPSGSSSATTVSTGKPMLITRSPDGDNAGYRRWRAGSKRYSVSSASLLGFRMARLSLSAGLFK